MKKFVKWLDKNFELTVMAILLAALTGVMLAEILLRTLRLGSIQWGIEFCQYCFVYSTFLAIPYCISADSNLKIDVLINCFSPMVQKIISFVNSAICIVFWGYMCFSARSVLAGAILKPQYSTTMGFSLAWIYGIPLIAFALAVIREIQHLIKLCVTGGPKVVSKEAEATLLNEAAQQEADYYKRKEE